MKSVKTIFLLSAITALLFFCSCEKECTEAGLGGNVTLVVKPQHHGLPILNRASYLDTVYLEFNTQDNPGSLSSYDTYVVGEAGEDHIRIEGLKCGDYYIYAVGFDTTISERVKGGIPYSFTETSGEIDVIVPVTED